MSPRSFGWAAAVCALACASQARATGPVCDLSPPTSTSACIGAVQKSGGVVNDIFRDSVGHTAQQLPLFGKLYNIYPGCNAANCAGCDPGWDTAPYDCPGQYACDAGPRDDAGLAFFDDVGAAVNKLDHVWGHPCRLASHGLVNGCPQYAGCVADGTGGSYNPWEGFVFDLGGASNQVAIFAVNDHGPQPCESLEYTVFLTDNPQSQDVVLAPMTTGADPMKWNRAVLSKVFTDGWYTTRSPDPTGHGTTCGDTADYAVEQDSFVQVFRLPCGANFRYAAIVAGNDGRDFPECAFDSSEAELDAVAGLTEQGAGVQICVHPPCGRPFGNTPCVEDAGGGITGPGDGGTGGSDSGGGDAAATADAAGGGADATTGSGDGAKPGSSGGCGCTLIGATTGRGALSLAGLAAFVALASRRRRRDAQP